MLETQLNLSPDNLLDWINDQLRRKYGSSVSADRVSILCDHCETAVDSFEVCADVRIHELKA